MSYYDAYRAIDEILSRPIAYHRAFRRISGATVAALFLSQAWYWKDRTSSEDGWFYKTAVEWEEETGLSQKEQATARKKLKAKGFISEERRGVPAKLYYRVNTEAVISELLKPNEIQIPPNGETRPPQTAKLDQTDRQDKTPPIGETFLYTENTSEITTENKGGETEKLNRRTYSEEFDRWWEGYRDFCVVVNAKPGSKKEAGEIWDKNESTFLDQHFQEADQIYRAREISRLKDEGRVYGIKHACRYLLSDEWENAFYANSKSAEVGVDFSNKDAVKAAARKTESRLQANRLKALIAERGVNDA